MKQIKNLLCGVMLTSFVILSSVSVFAAIPPSGGKDKAPKPECENKQVIESKSTEKASSYKKESNADAYIVGNPPISHRLSIPTQ